MSASRRFAEYIQKNAESLASEVVAAVVERMDLKVPEWEKEQAFEMFVGLFHFFGESIVNPDEDSVPRTLIAWSKKNAAMQVKTEQAVSEIIVRYPPTRSIFNEIITRISLELGLSVRDNANLICRIDELLDASLNETIFAYERYTEQRKRETQQELAKLSAPIVPVKDDIVILPLIGNIDMERANYILDHIVPQLAERGVTHVISDYSGVYTINEQIAAAMGKIGNTLRIMGIRVIVAGLRPDLAQAIVNSGLELKRMEPYATVKQALESIES
ncbi:STAS domain-containing protein [Indiicoccus explosivorum]|uniref:STAS domain-containing protein n=1 Tax=Indiicoccus explosivorum TaxID=1917864 RepID=UPI000B448E11|nr:STAS domain-containing protein [Indiicoccus explosivorum]